MPVEYGIVSPSKLWDRKAYFKTCQTRHRQTTISPGLTITSEAEQRLGIFFLDEAHHLFAKGRGLTPAVDTSAIAWAQESWKDDEKVLKATSDDWCAVLGPPATTSSKLLSYQSVSPANADRSTTSDLEDAGNWNSIQHKFWQRFFIREDNLSTGWGWASSGSERLFSQEPNLQTSEVCMAQIKVSYHFEVSNNSQYCSRCRILSQTSSKSHQ